jgi:TNF receptor-associated factor 4
LKSCNYERIECPQNCKQETIYRIDLETHLTECPMRIKECSHCQCEVKASQLALHHVVVCPRFPVPCPVCNQMGILREQVNAHLNIATGDCPMVIVPCAFRQSGCMFQDQRSKMDKHYAEANTHHMLLVSNRLNDLDQKRRNECSVSQAQLNEEIDHLTQHIEILVNNSDDMATDINKKNLANSTSEN